MLLQQLLYGLIVKADPTIWTHRNVVSLAVMVAKKYTSKEKEDY